MTCRFQWPPSSSANPQKGERLPAEIDREDAAVRRHARRDLQCEVAGARAQIDDRHPGWRSRCRRISSGRCQVSRSRSTLSSVPSVRPPPPHEERWHDDNDQREDAHAVSSRERFIPTRASRAPVTDDGHAIVCSVRVQPRTSERTALISRRARECRVCVLAAVICRDDGCTSSPTALAAASSRAASRRICWFSSRRPPTPPIAP